MLRMLLSTFVLIFAMLAAPLVLARGYDYVVCESRDYAYAECYVEGAREVSLHRRLSSSDCRRGKDWGVQRGVIWVDNGCAAEFAVEYRGGGHGHEGGQWADGEAVECRSEDYQRNRCGDFGWRDAALVEQISRSACVRGQSWGYDRRGLWVDEGCAGVFAEAGGRPGGHRPGGGNWTETVRTVHCKSTDRQYRHCDADIRAMQITLINQVSRSPCIEGRSWGVDRSGIWVDQGCEATFELRR